MNITKMIFILLVLFSVAVSIEAPTIIYPTNNSINETSYYVNWTSVTGATCYKIKELETGVTHNVLDTFYPYTKDEGKYTYIVQAGPDCYTWENNYSTPAFIIVDTTPPSVSSKSPSGVNEPLTGNVVVTFNESMNTSSFSISSDSGNISFGTPTWSDNDKTVTVPYTATNEGEEFTVNVSAKDLAGNWMSDSLQFTTLVKPTAVSITGFYCFL